MEQSDHDRHTKILLCREWQLTMKLGNMHPKGNIAFEVNLSREGRNISVDRGQSQHSNQWFHSMIHQDMEASPLSLSMGSILMLDTWKGRQNLWGKISLQDKWCAFETMNPMDNNIRLYKDLQLHLNPLSRKHNQLDRVEDQLRLRDRNNLADIDWWEERRLTIQAGRRIQSCKSQTLQ
jgi:hypothetical protein